MKVYSEKNVLATRNSRTNSISIIYYKVVYVV